MNSNKWYIPEGQDILFLTYVYVVVANDYGFCVIYTLHWPGRCGGLVEKSFDLNDSRRMYFEFSV